MVSWELVYTKQAQKDSKKFSFVIFVPFMFFVYFVVKEFN